MLELKEVITALQLLLYHQYYSACDRQQPPAAAAVRHPSEISLKYSRYVSPGNLNDANTKP